MFDIDDLICFKRLYETLSIFLRIWLKLTITYYTPKSYLRLPSCKVDYYYAHKKKTYYITNITQTRFYQKTTKTKNRAHLPCSILSPKKQQRNKKPV